MKSGKWAKSKVGGPYLREDLAQLCEGFLPVRARVCQALGAEQPAWVSAILTLWCGLLWRAPPHTHSLLLGVKPETWEWHRGH